ncbi:MAG TPA: hypothetical protein VKP61_15115 [Candidatus Acidoferrum sp.]|nr:hypothetical protein [Candidatus Acidoferrum sp.]
MQTLSCTNCGATSSSDSPIKVCPACNKPAESNSSEPASVAGGNAADGADSVAKTDAAIASAEKTLEQQVETQAAASGSPVVVVPPATSAATVSSTPAPAESTAQKIETGLAIGLDDVNAVAKLVATSFAGTPVAAIFALLGPAAGIGAAVLHQHLTNAGFDLSKLQPIVAL